MAQPLTTIDFTKSLNTKQQTKLQTQYISDFNKYKLALNSIVASRSVGLNNLYRLIQERMPTGLEQNQPSLLAQQYKLATSRSDNPAWYKQISTASSAAVQRETLIVLAQMQKQMFDNYMQQQRILMAMSMLQMSGSESAQLNLQATQRTLQNDISQLTGQGKQTTPPLTTTNQ